MSTPDRDNPPVIDRRPVPRGVLPKGIQTWLMVGIAGVIVVIILFAGQPDAPNRFVPAAGPAPPTSSDRVRDYQERLNAINTQLAMSPATEPAVMNRPPMPQATRDQGLAPEPGRGDPLAVERQRRDYESLFASNVVVSRRAPLQRSDARQTANLRDALDPQALKEPSLDEIAEAVVRATTRPARPDETPDAPFPANPVRAQSTGLKADVSAEPRYRIGEGTVIDAVLTNRLDGASAAPVNCLVTNAVYSQDGRRVLVPAGARILGETRAVEGWGETRLAVSFHRIAMPDGSSVSLDHFRGLNQLGDAGLRDQVNRHYWSTFGGAAAVGLVGGLSQLLGGAALASGDGNRTVIVAGGSADAASQAATQSLGQFLNRMPTITIREGHRVKVYVTQDVELPEWTDVVRSGVENHR